ncbi:hypothetical protein G4O51_11270 [Candidatus Bathyarchaeota archaeon A05DMB-2]|jgi:CRISPR type I-A-associated protein Csa5|nr:hypothetical protein [Candidatus Bathyarchaeota archaeon A05DMB-2]
MPIIHPEIANALATVVIASRSYTLLDRLANAISIDAVNKAIYELGRTLEVIIRNPKADQAIKVGDYEIGITGKWEKESKHFTIRGRLPEPSHYERFLVESAEDIRVSRNTAAYAAGLISSVVARSSGGGK